MYAHILSVVYYISAIITPVIVSLLIVFIWLLPCTYYTHQLFLHALLPIQSWAALDVFLVGSIAASMELDQVSQWIINTNFAAFCGPSSIIAKYISDGCFSVQGTLTYGTWLMVTTSIITWFSIIFTIKYVNNGYNEMGFTREYLLHLKLRHYKNKTKILQSKLKLKKRKDTELQALSEEATQTQHKKKKKKEKKKNKKQKKGAENSQRLMSHDEI